MRSVDLSALRGTVSLPELEPGQAELERLCIHNLLANSAERIFFKDLESRFLMLSAGWLEAACPGRPPEEIIGRTDFDVFSSAHASEAFADEQRIIETGKPIIAKIERETFEDRADVWVSTTKRPLRDGSGRIIGTYGITRDVTKQVSAQQALARQELHDAVTGLANRAAFVEQLAQALAALQRRPARVGVLLVDLDGFTEINDTRGHDLGDRLLAAVGQRLTLAVPRGHTVARFGGDEFVILSPRLASEEELERLATCVREAFVAPHLGDDGITITASVGVACTDDPATAPDELLARADSAMYAAKRGGRGGVERYDEDLHPATSARPELLDELREAVARDELLVLYQPVIRLSDGAVTGVEALVRWRHPSRGVLPPDQFIGLAERHGLIAEIDAHVMEEACRQLVAWERGDPAWRERTVAVNLSGHCLQDPRLPERVLGILTRHRLPASRLCLEITETALIGELDSARRVIACLSEHGVRIALDDFGTGFSTLAHLQQLEADVIKVDRSFVTRISREPRDRKIVAAVTAMAHALGMAVVGEGVESKLERDALTAVGCDEAQGYLFARPCAPEQIVALLRTAGVAEPARVSAAA